LEDLRTIVDDLRKKKPMASTGAVAPKEETDTRVSESPQRTQFMTMDSAIPGHDPKANTLFTKSSPDCEVHQVNTAASKNSGTETKVNDSEAIPGRESTPTGRATNHNRFTSSAEDRGSKHANDRQTNVSSNGYSTSAPLTSQFSTPAIMEYKIGWICALPFEAAAAEVMLDKQYPSLPLDSYGSTLYTVGRIGPHNVVIACLPRGRPGTSAASVVASEMRQKFRGIRFGFMVGIGGGVPSHRDDIRLGDVIVSQPNLEHGGVVQYDFGKVEEGGRFRRTGHLNNPPTFLLSVLNRVQINHERGRRTYPTHMTRFAEEDMEEYTVPQNERDTLFRVTCSHPAETLDCTTCDPDQIIKRPDRNTKSTNVKIHYGTIASGNQVIKDARTRDRIVEELGGQVLCFEMEAAGLMNDFPCLVIRGISDYCDSHKNDGWQRYAAASAAAYTRELLLLIPPEDVVK
jgi:nucleoside phosphorylase